MWPQKEQKKRSWNKIIFQIGVEQIEGNMVLVLFIKALIRKSFHGGFHVQGIFFKYFLITSEYLINWDVIKNEVKIIVNELIIN